MIGSSSAHQTGSAAQSNFSINRDATAIALLLKQALSSVAIRAMRNAVEPDVIGTAALPCKGACQAVIDDEGDGDDQDNQCLVWKIHFAPRPR